MADPAKKFSLVFTKTTKRPNLAVRPKNVVRPDRQIIDCLEGKSIKVKGGEEKAEEKQYIIPLQPSTRTPLIKSENGDANQSNEPKAGISHSITIKQEPMDADDSAQAIEKSSVKINIKTEPGVKIKTEPGENSLEEIAAQEILREAEELQKRGEGNLQLSVPTIESEALGENPTNEDYESIPVSAFGKAMLKGMGWLEQKGIGKKPQLVATVEASGPKRLSSSAEQALRAAKTASVPAGSTESENLQLVKGAFVKVVSGKMKGEYGEVEGFTDECDRVLVKMVIRSGTISFFESLLQVVSKSDFTKNSRVLNSSKYEEVKNRVSKSLEESTVQPSSKKSRSESDTSSDDDRGQKSQSPTYAERRKRSPSPRQKTPPAPEQRRDRRGENQGKHTSSERRQRSQSPTYAERKRRSPSPRQRRSPAPEQRRDRRDENQDKYASSERRQRSQSPTYSERKKRSPSPRQRRSPAPEQRRDRRDENQDKFASSERRYKKSAHRSPSPNDRYRKQFDSEERRSPVRKSSRRDSPRRGESPVRRRNTPSLSPPPKYSGKSKPYEDDARRRKAMSPPRRRSRSMTPPSKHSSGKNKQYENDAPRRRESPSGSPPKSASRKSKPYEDSTKRPKTDSKSRQESSDTSKSRRRSVSSDSSSHEVRRSDNKKQSKDQDSDNDSNKKVKKAKKSKHRRRSSSADSSDSSSSSPKRSSTHKQKKSHKKKKKSKRADSSSPDRRKKSHKK